MICQVVTQEHSKEVGIAHFHYTETYAYNTKTSLKSTCNLAYHRVAV